ncbi:hypothetical protein FALBO_15666 [Fusarium albosuccineum]|uniref:BZIP domain-containing protein n=1 Tax=Fusarium albosuccineum TaxID=1237068 RepID=A0A8H4KS58_9HYPO|nr:hypothetical protein FALBO_15666 [Fusarium albosuccineum]
MASFKTFRLVPVRDDVRDQADEWAGLSNAKERRKRQNRINQRAARRRQRLNQAQEQEPAEPTQIKGASASSDPSAQPRAGADVYFPLTRDSQLLHVISFNVSRAVLTNYFIISSIPLSTSRFCSVSRVFVLPSADEILLCSALGNPLNVTPPPALMPTPTQEQVPHPGWIDLFPSPQLRDNLILALQTFHIDVEAFMLDLVGEAFDSLCSGGEDEEEAESSGTIQPVNEATTSNLGDSYIGEPGLVSWSDPWDITGWEVTEPFTRKWGFLLQGCRDVVAAANVWRDIRGEDPLVVKV